jgi:hypothetical protein
LLVEIQSLMVQRKNPPHLLGSVSADPFSLGDVLRLFITIRQ